MEIPIPQPEFSGTTSANLNLSIQHTTHPSSRAGPPGKTLADL